MVQAERQATSTSGWSINNKKITVSAVLCGAPQVGERSVNSLYTGGASGETAQLLHEATPQYSTIHQWLLQSYWAFTRHLHISDKRNKKHFKATLPTVPTLFHLSNAYKTAVEVQMCLGGTTPLASLNPSKDIMAIYRILLWRRKNKTYRQTSWTGL